MGQKIVPPIKPPLQMERLYDKRLKPLILDPTYRHYNSKLIKTNSYAQALKVLDSKAYTPPALATGEARLAVAQHVQKLSNIHKAELIRKFQGALGVDVGPLLDDPKVRAYLQKKVVENVDLIKTIPPRFHAGLANKLSGMANTGKIFDRQAVRKLLAEEYGSSGYNLRRLTRDQTSKMVGDLTRQRQTDLGVKKYQWFTAGDERVRDSHRNNEGGTFFWNKPPPDTGHPGEDIQCRCSAIAILDTTTQKQIRERAAAAKKRLKDRPLTSKRKIRKAARAKAKPTVAPKPPAPKTVVVKPPTPTPAPAPSPPVQTIPIPEEHATAADYLALRRIHIQHFQKTIKQWEGKLEEAVAAGNKNLARTARQIIKKAKHDIAPVERDVRILEGMVKHGINKNPSVKITQGQVNIENVRKGSAFDKSLPKADRDAIFEAQSSTNLNKAMQESHKKLKDFRPIESMPKGVERYVKKDYEVINRGLRKPRSKAAKDPRLPATVKDIDKSMKPLTEDVVVYRGTANYLPDLKEGQIFVDKGYVSTSRSLYVSSDTFTKASQYSAPKSSLFEITAPRGTRAIVTNSDESEIIFARGTQFRVISVEKKATFIGDTYKFAEVYRLEAIQ